MSEAASVNTKSISSRASINISKDENKLNTSNETSNKISANPKSISARANMVKEFNDRNKK